MNMCRTRTRVPQLAQIDLVGLPPASQQLLRCQDMICQSTILAATPWLAPLAGMPTTQSWHLGHGSGVARASSITPSSPYLELRGRDALFLASHPFCFFFARIHIDSDCLMIFPGFSGRNFSHAKRKGGLGRRGYASPRPTIDASPSPSQSQVNLQSSAFSSDVALHCIPGSLQALRSCIDRLCSRHRAEKEVFLPALCIQCRRKVALSQAGNTGSRLSLSEGGSSNSPFRKRSRFSFQKVQSTRKGTRPFGSRLCDLSVRCTFYARVSKFYRCPPSIGCALFHYCRQVTGKTIPLLMQITDALNIRAPR